MTDENQADLTDNTLPDASRTSAADGQAAVADTLSLAELNQYLGKEFKDKATALKAVKDTFSYVGKKTDTVAQPSPELESKIQSLQNEVFFATHPEYKGYEPVIKAMGANPSEVVESEAFKTVFEKVKMADEVSQQRSVVASNSRIAQDTSYREQAANVANAVGASSQDVASFFASKLNGESQG